MGLDWGWMMLVKAVEEKQPGCQAEMLEGKVKWFFPGLVINKEW